MAVDPRREAGHIHKELYRYQKQFGETIVWYVFDMEASQYDAVYDEGYRRYQTGKKVPILWIDQQEAEESYGPEGRRPTQRLRCSVSTRSLWECGISITEAHGNRIQDISPSTVWKEDRLNDILYYDGRFYAISNFQIRGRLQGEDIIIGISAIETYPTDEMNLDTVSESWVPNRNT